MSFSIIAAVTKNGGIGFNNRLPWLSCPTDMKFFAEMTRNTTVIMGRKTFESLGHRGLAGRVNIVVTRGVQTPTRKRKTDEISCSSEISVYFCQSFEMALVFARRSVDQKIFVIGGADIYRQAIASPNLKEVYLTRLDIALTTDCDFPPVLASLFRIDQIVASGTAEVTISAAPQKSVRYEIIRYVPISVSQKSISVPLEHFACSKLINNEAGYLQCLRDIVSHGERREDRTGVGTVSLFGTTMRYDLTLGFPLFTTKRVFWRGVVAELLWFISGSTDVRVLQQQGVTIWNGNSTRAYLDKTGLEWLDEHTIGASYGFQFRHSGANYLSMRSNYRDGGFAKQRAAKSSDEQRESGAKQRAAKSSDEQRESGTDQLAYVVKELRENPTSRRAIICLWNPSDLGKMAIPPCLYSYQFLVNNRAELTCIITQRSGDMALGVPFNVASASLLTHMIGFLTGYKPVELIHNIADTHIYLTHLDGVKQQCEREPKPSPLLSLVNRGQKTIDDFVADDFVLAGYYPDGPIKMEMAI
jgi:dihydrofolate reductase / thymidylate synthase